MTWSPTRPPIQPRRGWTGPTRQTPAAPPPGWGLVAVRTATGYELAVADDSGITRLGAVLGTEFAAALDAGTITIPGMGGADIATATESGLILPAVRGDELGCARDRLGSLGFRRVETATAADLGVVRARTGGVETLAATDAGWVQAVARGDETATASDAGTGGFAFTTGAVTAATATVTVPIPPGCRYIDVIVLGGGGGGAGGTQGAPGWDGNGGPAGSYQSIRFDRGEGRNNWANLTFTIGAGGTGGTAKGGHGGAGGATSAWIVEQSSLTVIANGGPGATGVTLGAAGARDGKAPGNHTFQGITATGGGINSGVPGAGGRGGGGAIWPGSPSAGTVGARGQGWYRFS